MSFNANTNYASEIEKAISSGASKETVAALNASRNEKIAANQSHYSSIGVSSNDGYASDAYLYQNSNSGNSGASASAQTSQPEVQSVQPVSAVTDLSGYLKQLYAAQTEAKLASLKSAYDQNTASLQNQYAQIAPTYTAQKNQTAAESDTAQQNFNEVAAANGLNTGTTGQAALARGVALQNGLNTLSKAQADAQSANTLQQANLATEYQNAIAEAQASGNSSLSSALYDEYVRQANAATSAASAAQEQANWEKEYEQSVAQNKASAASEGQEYSYKTAMAMINAGVLPTTSLLNSAKISAVDAQHMVAAVKAEAAAKEANTSSGTTATKTKTKTKTKTSGSSGSGGNAPAKTSIQIPGSITTAAQLTAFLAKYGKSASGLMTQQEFTRHKNSGGSVYGNYKTYSDYLQNYANYILNG